MALISIHIHDRKDSTVFLHGIRACSEKVLFLHADFANSASQSSQSRDPKHVVPYDLRERQQWKGKGLRKSQHQVQRSASDEEGGSEIDMLQVR